MWPAAAAAWYNVLMISPNVNKILQETDALSDGERQELLRLLANRSGNGSGLTKESELLRQLVADGLVSHVPRRKKDLARYRQWQPVAIQGKPLSQTIVEERR
jgi:hypothetical protein